MHPCLQEPVATLLLPGTALQGFRASRSPSEPSCALHASTDGSLMTVCCQVSIPAERARAWSRGLMGQVAAEHVVVLGALAPDALRTEGGCMWRGM